MTSYQQPEKKDIVTLAKEISSNSYTLYSLTGDLPYRTTIMENLIEKNKSEAWWPHSVCAFIALGKADKTLAHEAYKQAVLSKMLVMGCNIKKIWVGFEEHMKMSTDNNNPYPITLA